MDNNKLELPIAVVSPTDVARLSRELESLDEFFRQSAIRQGGQPQSAPRYSRLLDEVVVANKLNLLQEADRQRLSVSFKNLAETAPVMHVSFSTDPPGPYVQKIVFWFRQNIRGDILVRVGLQPNIGAGCVVRSNSKSFDFSLKKFFDGKHDFFMQKLHEVVKPELEELPGVEPIKQVANKEATEAAVKSDDVGVENTAVDKISDKTVDEIKQASVQQTTEVGA